MSRRPEWWLDAIAKIWPLTWIAAEATAWPVVGGLVAKLATPMFREPNLNISYIPINREVTRPGSEPLPGQLVETLIRGSSHRAIIKRCTCRDARQCAEHPVTYGCLFLGEGAREIDPRIADHVSADEAIAHLRRCILDGLLPMAGRVKLDNLIWGVEDRGRLLTICFCCRCCCTVLASARYFPADVSRSLHRLEGLEVAVDPERCARCERCVEECFMEAIALKGGRIEHDQSRCKGCGRCATVCPEGAVRIALSDVSRAVSEMKGRIASTARFE